MVRVNHRLSGTWRCLAAAGLAITVGAVWAADLEPFSSTAPSAGISAGNADRNHPAATRNAIAVEPAPQETTADPISRLLASAPHEQMLLDSVADGSSRYDEPAFYLLMSKLSVLPKLAAESLRDLDQPAFANLIRYPDRYRYWPVRMKAHVLLATKLTTGQGLSPSRYWPPDKPLWRMECLISHGGGDQAAIIFSASPPDIGTWTRISSEGQYVYASRPEVEVAGVFYKLLRATSRGDNTQPASSRLYPIILCWQMAPIHAGSQEASGDLRPAVLFVGGLAMVLLIGWMMVRANRIRRRMNEPHPWPPRHDNPPPATDAADVDPLLKKAAEDFLNRTDTNKRADK